jgi:pyruvate oxidase
MGSSVAGAMGNRLGAPNRPTIAICGDGCFSMCLPDLAVAVRERIPLVVAVLNDERYGMVDLGHDALFGRPPPSPSGAMNITAMARSVGADAVRIDRAAQIANLELGSALDTRQLVLDIRIDRTTKMPKNGRFEKLKSAVVRPVLN